MNVRILHCKRALRTALLILLLGVAGMSNVLAYDFEADNLLYTIASTDPIVFADDNVKAICVANWDTDGDGELSYAEAAAVTGLGTVFRYNTDIASFDELQYFTGLTSIGGAAFYGCIGLTSVEIPNSVTSIQNQAFRECTGLTSVVIPNSITSIGGAAFYGCTGLTSVEIGNSVTSIGYTAFRGCTGLNSMEIPNSVTSIGDWAFYGCTGLTSVEIGNSVTSIGNYAFEGCSGLEQIVVDTGNTVYDSRNNCDAIIETATNTLIAGCKNTVIPNSVTSIGNYAFRNCTGLTSVVIPNSVTSIGGSAFYGCTGLTSVEIPNSVTSIREWVFYGCTGLTSMTVHAEIPPTLGGDVFDGNMGIPVYVPCGSMEAYQNAEGWSAFTNYQCLDNTNILFADDNVKAICVDNWDTNGDGELSYAEAAAVTDLGFVFQYNDQITSFDELQYFIGLVSIGYGAFNDCNSLTSVVIPNSVILIEEDAFFYCSGLTSIEIPNSVTFIGSWAFCGCSSLSSIVIPNSVTDIENGAFSGCKGLISIEIPNSVAFIGNGVFRFCNSLEQLTVGTGNPVYDSRDNCNAIVETATNTLVAGCKNTVIPNSVTSIGAAAFRGCTGLTSVEIPNSVTTIGESAFSYCDGLTSVEIPNSVTSIGSSAFSYCTGLTEITMLGTNVPSLGDVAFDETNDCPIYVPYESLNNYKTAENWSEYEDRIFPMAYKTVSGYGEGEGKWAFIASPLTDDTEPTAITNMTGTAYDLYRFNQSAELEWENYKANSFSSLANGQGYLYANTEDVNLVFKGTFNEDETKETDLVYDAAADFAGWNLVGNPFPYAATVDRSHYVMNAEGTALEPTALSEGTSVAPCTGVMVKADTEGETVTFSKAMRQGTANNGLLRIAVPDGDKAIVSFNAGDRLEKFGFGNQKATISIPQGGKDYAIAYSEGKGEMPLNFKAAKNGEYTLTVDMENVDLAYLRLIDNLTGADVDLLVSPEYTFTAKTTDYASRFRLLFSANENGDDTTGAEGDSFAFIDAAGNIVVDGAEAGSTMQIVDVTGRVVRVCTDVARNVSTSGMTTGVYVLRLINGDDVKTQKIVID